MTMIQRHTDSRWRALFMETLPLRNKNLHRQEQICHAIPGDKGQLVQRWTWCMKSERSEVALKSAIAAFAVAVFRRLRLGWEFLEREELMTGHAGFPSFRHLHQPHPAAEMQRHCHQQCEHDLEWSGGHDVDEWSVGKDTFNHVIRPTFFYSRLFHDCEIRPVDGTGGGLASGAFDPHGCRSAWWRCPHGRASPGSREDRPHCSEDAWQRNAAADADRHAH